MSTPPLKYNPQSYSRLHVIAGWLVDGKKVQITGALEGAKWQSFDQKMGSIEILLNYGCEFRVKPSKPADKKAKGWVVE